MAVSRFADLTDQQVRTLERIADDAVHKAAEAAAQLLAIDLKMSAVRARSVFAEDVPDAIGDPEETTVAIYLRVEGSAPGHAAFISRFNDALMLVDMLMMQPAGTQQDMDELALSALQELGNILTSSYLNALSESTGLTFLPHPPQIAVDMAYSLVTAITVGTVESSGTQALSIVTKFDREIGPLQGHFVFIPDSYGISVLLERLKEAA